MANDHLLFDLPIYKKPNKPVEPLASVNADSVESKPIDTTDNDSFFDKLDKFLGFKE